VSDETGPAAAAIVVVDDEVVEVLEVLEVELVDVDRCVVVVLRCVVVVRGAWVVVVGAGAAVVVVVGAGVSVVVVVGGGGSSAPAGPTPIPNTAIMSNSTAPPRAATEARRGVDGHITSLTLDRRCLLTWSVIRHVGRLALMLRTGIGGATTDGAA
jgi:Iap family predicted aminopeptidase